MFNFKWFRRLSYVDRSRIKHETPKRQKLRRHVIALKTDIQCRLATEDYTCRLPRPVKPRVRYKLTRQLHGQLTDGWMEVYRYVYK